ncbi:hypothetical protein ACA910_014785 [Epithemia clementina (nom. ined.)]
MTTTTISVDCFSMLAPVSIVPSLPQSKALLIGSRQQAPPNQHLLLPSSSLLLSLCWQSGRSKGHDPGATVPTRRRKVTTTTTTTTTTQLCMGLDPNAEAPETGDSTSNENGSSSTAREKRIKTEDRAPKNVGESDRSSSSSFSDSSNSSTLPNSQLDWNWISQQAAVWRQLAWPYYQESSHGRLLLFGVILLTLLNSGVSVVFSYLSKDFWNALSDRNVTEFYAVLQKFLVALALGAPIVTYFKYQREQLAVDWREWMTTRTVQLYTQNRVYYQLEEQKRSGTTNRNNNNNNDALSQSQELSEETNGSVETTAAYKGYAIDDDTFILIDNPDQRISEDVNTFTSYSLQFTVTVLTSIIDLVAFSVILYQIYPQLLVAVLIYSATGTTVTTFLGQSLVGLNLWQLQREADLRYLLVRWRDNAESIAFYQGETLEGAAVQTQLSSVVDNRRSINTQQRNLEYFVNAYRYLVQVLPLVVVAPQYFSGAVGLGVISQAAGAFNHILNDLSLLINQFERLSSFSAGLERLSSFYEAMQQQHGQSNMTAAMSTNAPLTRGLLTLPVLSTNNTATWNGEEKTDSSASDAKTFVKFPTKIQFEQIPEQAVSASPQSRNGGGKRGVILSVQNLTLCTPDRHRVLVRNLTLDVFEGQHLLIVGPSGAGKSSLLRALAGLWTSGQGTIARPAKEDDIYFLPQRPYCTLGGSLKEQLLYPKRRRQQQQRRWQQVQTDSQVESLSSSTSTKDDEVQEMNGGRNDADCEQEDGNDQGDDEQLLHILKQVNLWHVAHRAGNGNATAGLYSVQDWTNVLSLGEQQRLAFGRLLVHQPRLVILDEATSALDMVAEARMYQLLQDMARKELSAGPDQRRLQLSSPGLTYVSVGHRPSLLAFHDKRLRLFAGDEGEGCVYEWSDIDNKPATLVSVPSVPAAVL